MQSLVLAYLAGTLTTLNPCVLPMLPFVVGAALGAGRLGPLAMMAGLTLTFTIVGVSVAAVGFGLGIDADILRLVGAWIMLALGLVMLVPRAQGALATASGPLVNSASGLLDRFGGPSLTGQFAAGSLLAIVWAPCTGPTLGAAIGLASQGGSTFAAAGIMLAFALGASTIMLIFAYGAREFLARRRSALMALSGSARTVFGVIFVSLGIVIISGLDKIVETALVKAMPDWLIELTTRL